jgi:hypothetical protein
MRVLELFSGSKSVGKVCDKLGWEVVSLDLKNADINIDILNWNYKDEFKPYDFDIIWASPPCDCFSKCQFSNINRRLKDANGDYYICTKETIQNNIDSIGLPILRKTQEIIDYLEPTFYFIENPQTGCMKDYLNLPYYDVDYCRYSDWGIRKRTRIWTNLKDFIPLLCSNNFQCGNKIPLRNIHTNSLGSHRVIKVDDKIIRLNTKELRILYKGYPSIQKTIGCHQNNRFRYRIPPKLIEDLFLTAYPN